MLIGISGYGYSGASAYRDLLKEFSNISCFPAEFQLLQESDGLIDLKYGLVVCPRRVNSNTVICRFKSNINSERHEIYNRLSKGQFTSISESFIDSIILASWKGRSSYDPVDINRQSDTKSKTYFASRLIRYLKRKLRIKEKYPMRYYSLLSETDFNIAANSYLRNIINACGYNLDDNLILEQAFCVENPTLGFDLFPNEDIRVLIVNRDPRDVYILTNYIYKQKSTFMPNSGNVKHFISYYRSIRQSVVNDPRVLYVSFEDLIYEYQSTVLQLRGWINSQHIAKKRYFNPEFSIANTQLYTRFPDLKEEITVIENELSEYLYPFETKTVDFSPKYFNVFDRQSEIKGE